MKESIKVLNEAIELQKKKSSDYQNPNSNIKQANHYPRGIATILDMVHQKITRMYSLTESGYSANFESVEDSAIDAINYLSFLVEYSRGKMDGQDPNRDAFNRAKNPGINKEPKESIENTKDIMDKQKLQKYYKDVVEELNRYREPWKQINPSTMLINDGTYGPNNSPISSQTIEGLFTHVKYPTYRMHSNGQIITMVSMND